MSYHWLFLDPGVVEFVNIDRQTGVITTQHLKAGGVALDYARQSTFMQEDRYFCVCRKNMPPEPTRRSTSEYVSHAICLWVDIDNPVKPKELDEFPPPTLIVHSGHGWHIYWRLRLHVAADERFLSILRGVTAAIPHADPKCVDVNRLLRIPGSYNYKDASRPVKAEVYLDNAVSYDLQRFGHLAVPNYPKRIVITGEANDDHLPIERVAELLGARKTPNGWEARCPAHDDKSPSLTISQSTEGNTLMYCHAGCSFEDIVAACGLHMSQMFSRSVRQPTLSELRSMTQEKGE